MQHHYKKSEKALQMIGGAVVKVLESLRDQLQSENEYLVSLVKSMQDSIKTGDYDHLCREAAEASQIKGRIETLKKTIYMIEKSF